MKQYAQNQHYTSFSFWDLKVLIASLGMPDPTLVKLHHQFVALRDMYLHTQNWIYTSNSFWDIKVKKSCNPIGTEHFCI